MKPVLALVLCGLVVGGVIALLNPWALHMGGRPTLLLTWRGFGKLHTKDGIDYPLYLYFNPSSHASRLRREGKRPVSGLQGYGCFCTSPIQYLELSGTIFGNWSSTEGNLVAFRLLERRTARDNIMGNMERGYFDLTGEWRGQDLVMDERGAWSHSFRSGLRIDQASVTLHPDDHWTCKAACAAGHSSF